MRVGRRVTRIMLPSQCVLSGGTYQPGVYPVAEDAPVLPLEAGMCRSWGTV